MLQLSHLNYGSFHLLFIRLHFLFSFIVILSILINCISLRFWNRLCSWRPRLFVIGLCFIRFIGGVIRILRQEVAEILSIMYSLRFLKNVLNGFIHFFRFQQKFTYIFVSDCLLSFHISKIKERITNIINIINLSLRKWYLMTKLSKLNPLMTLKSFQNTRIFRSYISSNDILNKPNFLNTIFQAMKLSYDLISFIY